ncbi:MAG: MBL fold metallo-hydrolase [Thermodesulfobacteriota bacterium]
MRITCWGSRGSVPVSGKPYNKYGGDTTCIEIRTQDDHVIIVDAGTGIRRLGNGLIAEGRYDYDMIFTHAHWDHLMGFPFFKPLYLDRTEIRFQGCPFAQKFVESMLNKVMSPPNFPVRYDQITAQISHIPECPERMEIGSVTIIPISLSHPNGGNGYKFVENDRSFVFLTDNELDFQHPHGNTFEKYMEFSMGSDLLIHDAEYTEKEYKRVQQWGHSTYTSALELAISAGVKRLGLFHLNQDRTDEEMDRIAGECRSVIKKRGVDLECFAVGSDMTFVLE